MKFLFTALLAISLTPFCIIAQQIDTSVHTVLFLGNSITYAGSWITDIEAAYTIAHPNHAVNFINLGLPSETVSGLSEEGHAGGRFSRPDLHERLHRILQAIQPDIVFTCYGMNDGIYLPLDPQRFQKYKDGMIWLHDTLVKTGARVIIVTPPVYDELRAGAKGYAAVLDSYAAWLLSQKKAAHWEVADIHFPMKKYLETHRQLDAAYGVDGFALAADGVHPGEAGHWLIAKQLLLHLKERNAAKYPDIKSLMQSHANGPAILQLIIEKQGFMKDAWLTATGHTRPEMKTGMPLQDANTRAAEINKKINLLLQQ